MASMASQIVFSSNRPRDPTQQKHAFFDAQDYIPAEVLIQIKNPMEANEIGFFFYKKKEKITGVTLSSEGYLSKIFTVSQDNMRRVWGKKLRNKKQEGEKFVLCAEMKQPPRVETKLAAVSPVPSTAID